MPKSCGSAGTLSTLCVTRGDAAWTLLMEQPSSRPSLYLWQPFASRYRHHAVSRIVNGDSAEASPETGCEHLIVLALLDYQSMLIAMHLVWGLRDRSCPKSSMAPGAIIAMYISDGTGGPFVLTDVHTAASIFAASNQKCRGQIGHGSITPLR